MYSRKRYWKFFKHSLKLFSEIEGVQSGSVDLTIKCRMNCEGCYFKKAGYDKELGDADWRKKILVLKANHPNIINMVWIGGDPLLRKDLLRSLMNYFDFNLVVTTGLIELPKWKDCNFGISIDGTHDYHNQRRGFYDRIKRTIDQDDIWVTIAFTLTEKNHVCLKDFVEEWSNTSVRGVGFSFLTPIIGEKSSDLIVKPETREKIIDRILDLKKKNRKYRKFILNSDSMLSLMRPENTSWVAENCPVKDKVVSLDPMGQPKHPCMMDNANCSQCGCIISHQMLAKGLENTQKMLRYLA